MKVIHILTGLFCVIFVSLNFYLLSDIFINYPVLDDYGAIVDFMVDYLKTPTWKEKITLLFSQNNDFKLGVLKLITLTHFYVFGNINFAHFRIFGYLCFLSCWYFYFKLGKFSFRQFAFFLPVPLLSISFAYVEINALAMESLSHFLVIALTIATFYCLFEKKQTILPLFLLFFGVFSNGNGLLIVPLGALGLLLTKDYKRLLIWSMASIFTLYLFFFNYNSQKIPLNFALAKRVALVFPIHLGGIGGLESVWINFTFGILALLGMAYFFFIERDYKKHMSLYALLLFFSGTYLMISTKRSVKDLTALLRGAYLINSIMIFVVLYVLFYKIKIRKSLNEKTLKSSYLTLTSILLFCMIYQGRNFSKWARGFGHQKSENRIAMADFYGHTAHLHADEGGIYNIPIINHGHLDSLSHQGVFDTSESLNQLLVQPSSIKGLGQGGEFDSPLDIVTIDGLLLPENPFITISCRIKSFIKTPFNRVGLKCVNGDKTSYFNIPVPSDKLFFLKNAMKHEFSFDFILPKKYLSAPEFTFSFYKIEDKKVFFSEAKKALIWEKEATIKTDPIAKPRLATQTAAIDTTRPTDISAKFIEALHLSRHDKILVGGIKADTSTNSNNYFLGFKDTESDLFFITPMQFETPALLSTTMLQTDIASLLGHKNSLFRLSLIHTKKDASLTSTPLKTLYFFKTIRP
jgi:hypothetical protein